MPDPETSYPFDVAILGAGAAGLFAAIRAAERGRTVVLLEKNRRAGVKILMSGGTRCNLTNARGLRNLGVISGPVDPGYDPREARGARAIQAAFGPNGVFLAPSLKALSVEATVELFEAEGVATYVEPNGKVFPASDRATDVLAALLARLSRAGVTPRVESPIFSVEPKPGGGFTIEAGGKPLTANRVILCVGGQSYPGCGTRGDGYAIARRFGHSIVEPRPALVPLRVTPSWVPELKGLALPDVVASILPPTGTNGPTLLQRREAVLFAHFGLSGPAILDISRAVARHDGPDPLTLTLDLDPGTRAETLEAHLVARSRVGRPSVLNLLPEPIPRRLGVAVLDAASVPPGRTGPELSRDERRRLVSAIKGLALPVAGTLGFAKAEVTSGGVSLGEVHPETLESRLQPGLHFAGEVLDLDGLIGGYNFQAAWSTGWLAGQQA